MIINNINKTIQKQKFIKTVNEASRANMIDFRTSNFQEAAIKPIVSRQGMPIFKNNDPKLFF